MGVGIRILSGRATEVCEELRTRIDRVDVCCVQDERWRCQEARFMDIKEVIIQVVVIIIIIIFTLNCNFFDYI